MKHAAFFIQNYFPIFTSMSGGILSGRSNGQPIHNLIIMGIATLFQKPTCYNTCTEVQMSAFIKAIVHGDYSGLTKSGRPTTAMLEQAWETVFNQYLTLSGDTSVKKLLALLKDIAIISNKLTLIEIIVGQLQIGHIEGLAQQLRNMGFRFKYEDNENLQRELELTMAQSRTLLNQLNQDKAELDAMRAKDGSQSTEQDFETHISALEEFKGVSINTDNYTVARYCADVNRMKQRYERNLSTV